MGLSPYMFVPVQSKMGLGQIIAVTKIHQYALLKKNIQVDSLYVELKEMLCLLSSLPVRDFQPGCRGTQGCLEEVSGVPQNTISTAFSLFYCLSCILKRARVAPIFLVLIHAVNKKG
jgi:hypothetical protein